MIKALITIYNPGENISENIIQIAKQTDFLYICDNSLNSHEDMFLGKDFSGKLCYVYFGENLGLSGAFNRTLKSKEYNFSDEDYIFFFDQDTFISDGHIENMINEYES